MNDPVNSPHPQDGPVLFAFLCVAGSVFAIGGLITLPVATEPWWVGVFGQLIILGGFLAIELGWLWIQREVAFADGTIVVRRWIDALRGRPGRAIPVGDETRVAITLENVRSLRIERNGVAEAVLTLGYWEPHRIRELVDAMRARGISFAQYWDGDYPPGT